MDAMKSMPTAETHCNGGGWIRNPNNSSGFFACRGCPACMKKREILNEFQSSRPPLRILVEDDAGAMQPVEVARDGAVAAVTMPAAEVKPEKIRKVRSKKAPPLPEAMHGAADEFGGEDYPPPQDYGASPHELEPAPTPAPLVSYSAPDALPGQLPLVRVPHTLEEVEAVGGYQAIYADPPWSYVQQGRGVAENHYKTMSIDEIKALPVGRLASKDAVLFLWGTWPQLPVVLETMVAWGFTFKTCGWVWVKHHESSGKECVGGGFWTRANSEFCLIGVRGKHPKRIDKTVRQLVQAPRGEHSAKPAEVRDRIRQLMGDLPAIELFARERVEFMDAWGNDPALGGSDVIL